MKAPVAQVFAVSVVATLTAVPAAALDAVVLPDTPVTVVVESFEVAPGYDLTNVSVVGVPNPVSAELEVATPTAVPEADAVKYFVVALVFGTVAVT